MGFLDFVKRVYRKMSDKFSYLNIPNEKALVAKLDFERGPGGEKVLRRAYLVIPNDVVLEDGDHYFDMDGRKHTHHGRNEYTRVWPNRIEVFDFQNISACRDFIKRLGSKWDPETARYDHAVIDFRTPGPLNLPIDIVKLPKGVSGIDPKTFVSDRKMAAKLLSRAVLSIAIAQGLERVYFGKGIPASLKRLYVGPERRTVSKKQYVRVYDSYVPKGSTKLQSPSFRENLEKRLHDDRIDILRTMNRYVSMSEKLYKVRTRVEIAEVTDYKETNDIAVAHVIPKKSIEIAAKKADIKKQKIARR